MSFFIIAVFCIITASAAGPLQLSWSNDPVWEKDPSFASTFGPDGPWQGVLVSLGNFSTTSGPSLNPQGGTPRGVLASLYPCGSSETGVLPAGFGGTFSIIGSNASNTAVIGNTSYVTDTWFATYTLNATLNGKFVQDYVQFSNQADQSDIPSTKAAMFVATGGWNNSLPNAKTYASEVGILGLGKAELWQRNSNTGVPSILDQLTTNGDIESGSLGLHIGSVAQQIPGSLLLGGFDQGRVLGPVGVYEWIGPMGVAQFATWNPVAFLMDVTLGTACNSPFPGGSIDHLYKGLDANDTKDMETMYNAPPGSAAIWPNPAYPYISLSPGTCEAVASNIPVTWDSSIGYYLWNQSDDRFAQLIHSSAYMEFILSDLHQHNTSIKVSFALLNLTLESPITNAPTPYFPCISVESHTGSGGYWMLGRAFLQAAFFGMNYDQNLTFLAQAPGPLMNQSSVKAIRPSDTTLIPSAPDALGALVDSWQAVWNDSSCAKYVNLSTSGGSDTSGEGAEQSSGIGAGAIAGIAVGGAVAAALVLAAAWLLRRRRSRNEIPPENLPDNAELPAYSEVAPDMDRHGQPRQQPQEIGGGGETVAHEMKGYTRNRPHLKAIGSELPTLLIRKVSR